MLIVGFVNFVSYITQSRIHMEQDHLKVISDYTFKYLNNRLKCYEEPAR